MKWAVLLGSPDISGGTIVIFEHALRAQANGHQVCIVSDAPVPSERLDWIPAARQLRFVTFEEIEAETFDLALATWWRTAYEIHRVNSTHYGYFVQSIESRFYSESDVALRALADATYRLPLRFVTEATWIRDHLRDSYGCRVSLARNGIHKEIFKPEGASVAPRTPGRVRALVEGALHVAFKNVERTLRVCRRAGVDEVWLLTPSEVRTHPLVDRIFSRIPLARTAEVYRSCDVLVKQSLIEGMFGPPLEIFHCGGTAITYAVTGHEEYLVHDQNALVAPLHDEDAVVRYLRDLCRNPLRLQRLKGGALATAASWPGWETASALFVGELETWTREAPHDRRALEAAAGEHLGAYAASLSPLQRILNLESVTSLKRLVERRWPAVYRGTKKGRELWRELWHRRVRSAGS
jgi:glycosyltransferase involved in cell wall biosynthesis